MKRKLRIFSNIAIICLSVCMFAFGVYAANQVSVTTSGTVSFTASGVYAEISGVITGMDNAPVLSTLKYANGVEPTETELNSWKDNALTFKDSKTPIQITITITNKATDRNLDFTIVDNSQTGTNVNKKLNVSAHMYDETNGIYNVNPYGIDGNTQTIVITFNVDDANSSASLDYDYAISLTDQEKIESSMQELSSISRVGNVHLIKTTLSEGQQMSLPIANGSSYYEYFPFIEDGAVVSPFHEYSDNGITSFTTPVAETIDTNLSFVETTEGYVSVGKSSTGTITADTYIPLAIYQTAESGIQFVDTIASRGFYECSDLVITNFPKTLKTIEEYGLDGTGLTSCKLPEGLISIGLGAFAYCTGLNITSLPNSIQIIGNYAFKNASQLSLTCLPASLVSIGDSAFEELSNLTISKLPEGLINIGKRAFYGCSGITINSLPEGVTVVNEQVFAYCQNITSFSFHKKVTFISSVVFYSPFSPTTIEYEGTKDEWRNVLENNVIVNVESDTTVSCSDGDIKYDSSGSEKV